MTDPQFTRRQVLAGGIGGAAALGLAAMGSVRASGAETVRRAASVKAAGTDVSAIKHVVFLMQENRSFDHYFGTMGGVIGYDDTNNRSAFTQAMAGRLTVDASPVSYELEEAASRMHKRSGPLVACRARLVERGGDGQFRLHPHLIRVRGGLGINTMGYYTKTDLPFYYELAQKFTVCDNYFCSVLGPTHPNRLMAMTGSIDPLGVAGGPILVTKSQSDGSSGRAPGRRCRRCSRPTTSAGRCTTRTAPLPPGAGYFFSKNMLLYFDQYKDSDLVRSTRTPSTTTGRTWLAG